MSRKTGKVFLPELVDHRLPGAWKSSLVNIRDSSVNLEERIARVPAPYTEAQRLARLHELGHVRYSPRYWSKVMADIVNMDPAGFEEGKYDPSIVSTLAKMVEENRIDWILWSSHEIDLRPAREVFDWSAHPIPDKAILALDFVLQLAWTVWASRGLGKLLSAPPPRDPDPGTSEFFDKCWQVCLEYRNELGILVGPELVKATINACRAIYKEPTDYVRNVVTLELLKFFPPPPKEEPEPPEEKEEEKQEQQEAEQEEKEKEEAASEELTGLSESPVTLGHYQIHDHTAGARRPRSRIARRDTPQPIGSRLAFPQRYMTDRVVFGRRIISEAGIMVDGSSSMSWSNENLQLLMKKLPAVWVGFYSGYTHHSPPVDQSKRIYGRICVLAKRGRFCHWEGHDHDEHGRMDGNNEVDLEALELLATWPKPRLWLSDGDVCGGVHTQGPLTTYPGASDDPDLLTCEAKLEYACDRIMKRAGILRVPDLQTMLDLIARKRVTLFRSTMNYDLSRNPWKERVEYYTKTHPDIVRTWEKRYTYGGVRQLEPVSFQL